MAKDLPYFKFIVSEWNDGDITLCSFEAQGLFINLCSMYWSQSGKLSLTKAKRRFSGCNASAWEELISEQIIKVEQDEVSISFLDLQFGERKKLSTNNSQNAKERWNKHKNATALPSNSDRKLSVSNIEERRGEEKRGEKKVADEILGDWIQWGKMIVANEDHQWHGMRGRKVTEQEINVFLSVAVRCGWKLETQNAFRVSLNGFKVKEYEKEKVTVYTKGKAFGEE